jgi:hypothetical protein
MTDLRLRDVVPRMDLEKFRVKCFYLACFYLAQVNRPTEKRREYGRRRRYSLLLLGPLRRLLSRRALATLVCDYGYLLLFYYGASLNGHRVKLLLYFNGKSLLSIRRRTI